MENYENLGTIGEGTYGVVLKCRHKETGQIVAIKKFKESDEDEQVRKTALREVRILKQLKHENIVNLIEVFRRKGKLYLVFEYVDRTILEDLEKHPDGLGKNLVKKLMWQLCRALEFCHAHNVIHRDIKPENLLVSKNGVLKICDFGFARTLAGPKAKYTDYVSTRWYRSPELLVGDTSYGKGVDVWAIGCMFAEITNGLPLFPGESDIDQLFHIIRCFGQLTGQQMDFFRKNPLFVGVKIPEVENAELETLEKRFPGVSKSQLEAMSLCLDYDPDRRATCTELMRCEHFESFASEFRDEFKASLALDDSEFAMKRKRSKKRDRGRQRNRDDSRGRSRERRGSRESSRDRNKDNRDRSRGRSRERRSLADDENRSSRDKSSEREERRERRRGRNRSKDGRRERDRSIDKRDRREKRHRDRSFDRFDEEAHKDAIDQLESKIQSSSHLPNVNSNNGRVTTPPVKHTNKKNQDLLSNGASSKYDDNEGSKSNATNTTSNSSMLGIDSRELINKKNQYDKPIERSSYHSEHSGENDSHSFHLNDPGLRASTPKAARLVAFPNLRLDDENQGAGIRKLHGGRGRRYTKDMFKPSVPKRGVIEANASFLLGNRFSKVDQKENRSAPKDVTNSNDQRIGREKMVREKDAGGMPYEFKFGEADSSINHHHHSYSSHGRNGSSRGTHSSREDSHKRTALNYYQPTGFSSKKVNYNNINSSGYGQRSSGYGQQSDRFSFKGPPSSHARQPPSSSGRNVGGRLVGSSHGLRSSHGIRRGTAGFGTAGFGIRAPPSSHALRNPPSSHGFKSKNFRWNSNVSHNPNGGFGGMARGRYRF